MKTPFRTLACRILFLVLIAAPTCGVLLYAASAAFDSVELTPQGWSSLLSEKSGLEIKIGKMQRTASGVFLLEDFAIGDPESEATWIASPRVEAMLDARGLTLAMYEAEIEAKSLRKLSEHLQHRVLRSRTRDFTPLLVMATNSKLLLDDESRTAVTLPKMELATSIDERGPCLEVKSTVLEGKEEVWVELAALRIRGAGEPTTQVRWKVEGGEGISTRTLAAVTPEWAALGPVARFRGTLIDLGGARPHYQLSGVEIRDIDLETLGAAWGVEGLSGIASVGGAPAGVGPSGARCEVREGQFSDLSAEVAIYDGGIEGEMLQRLASALHWQVAGSVGERGRVKFDELALAVELFGGKLRLQGLVDESGGVMRRQNKLLARQQFQGYRSARDVFSAVLEEVQPGALPTAQILAALPEPRTAPATRTAAGRSPKR